MEESVKEPPVGDRSVLGGVTGGAREGGNDTKKWSDTQAGSP